MLKDHSMYVTHSKINDPVIKPGVLVHTTLRPILLWVEFRNNLKH